MIPSLHIFKRAVSIAECIGIATRILSLCMCRCNTRASPCAQHKGPGCMHPSVGSANKDAGNNADTPWLQDEALDCNRWKRLTGTLKLGRLR